MSNDVDQHDRLAQVAADGSFTLQLDGADRAPCSAVAQPSACGIAAGYCETRLDTKWSPLSPPWLHGDALGYPMEGGYVTCKRGLRSYHNDRLKSSCLKWKGDRLGGVDWRKIDGEFSRGKSEML